MKTTSTLFLTLLILLTACGLPPTQQFTTAQVIFDTPVPTVEREMQPIEQNTDEPAENCEPDTTRPLAQHTVWMDIDYDSRLVAVRHVVDYINRTSEPLSEIVLSAAANQWDGALAVDGIVAFGETLPYQLDGIRLTIPLSQPLAPDCAVSFEMTYTLNVPPLGNGVNAYRGYFSYSSRQLNLGHALLTVAPIIDGNWISHEPIFIGEQSALEVADWDVTIEVANAANTLLVAAPGAVDNQTPTQWHFIAAGARDFAVSMSDQFEVLTQQIESGVTVELYHFPDVMGQAEDETPVDSAAHALDSAARALALYENLFGAYPYSRMVVVQGEFPDGMEFSGLVFVSSDWFWTFTGDPAGFLTVITVHEVAHQWWYARVGNDAALNPYLDEALATYSEYVFIEEYYPQLREWWWDFRVNAYNPGGNVDGNVYEFTSIREYINAVYLRGVRMLDALREDLGTEAFFDWLRAYAEAGAGLIVTPDLFWSLLTPEQLDATQETRDEFFDTPFVVDSP